MQTDPAPSPPPPSTPPPPPQRQIHAALQLLKGPSDEARFAGLLMIVKHLNKDKGTSPSSQGQQQQQQQQQQIEENEIRRQVLDAVTPQFLARLLVSSSASSTTTTATTSPFRSVALAIIAALMQDATLVPRLRPLLKYVLVVMDSLCVEKGLMMVVEGGGGAEEATKKKEEEEESRNQLLEDCLFYIYLLARHDQSALCVEALAAQRAFGGVFTCVETLAMKIRAKASKSQEAGEEKGGEGRGEAGAAVEKEKDEEDEQIDTAPTTITTTTTTTDTDPDDKLLTQACATLREMALLEEASDGTYGWVLLLDQGESNDTNTFTRMARLLNQESSQLKLHLLHLLSLLLSHRRGRSGWWVDRQTDAHTHIHTQAFASFGSAMRPALLQLLHGGLREAHRDPALALLVHMLHLFGQGWAVEEDEKEKKTGDSSEHTHTHTHTPILPRGSSAGFFVAALAAETRMAAEELETLANVGEEIIHTDTLLQRRLVRAREMLPLCLDGLDAVLRFLCGAVESESECVSVCGRTEARREWESLPGAVLLNMRGSIHEAVGALIKLLQEAAREWKLSECGGGGGGGGLGGKGEEKMEVGERRGGEREEEEKGYLEPVVRFLTAVLAEDEACMKVEEVLSILPFVMFLVEGHTHRYIDTRDKKGEEGKGRGAGGWSCLWVLPWISRVLAEEEEEGCDGYNGTALFRLVDECQVHVWLVEKLMMYTTNTAAASTTISTTTTTRGLPPATERMIKASTKVSACEEQAQIDMLFALQELLARGGKTIPCEDCGCLLICHPKIIEELVPSLCVSMHVNVDGSTSALSASFRLRLYRLWFVLSLLVEEDEMMVGKILPVGGEARGAVVEAMREMVLDPEMEGEVMMLLPEVGEEREEEEGEHEVKVLWRRVRELVTVEGVGRVLGVRGGR